MSNETLNPSAVIPNPRTENIIDFVLNDKSTLESLTSGTQIANAENYSGITQSNNLSARTKSRVLFISTEPSFFVPQSELREKLASLNTVFEEIHIAVIEQSGTSRLVADKAGERVWVYGATAKHWWQMQRVAEEMIESHLHFTDGFRADIIVALDALEAGYIGLKLSEKYGRPFQIHLLEDIFAEAFSYSHSNPSILLRLARYVLNKTHSVCVSSEAIKQNVKKNFKHLKDPILLPRFYNIKSILSKTSEPSVKPAKLVDFKFIVLFVGVLNHDSTLFRAIDATRTILRSPAIAMVVIGDGPMKKEFQRRAEIFGVKEQIIFEPATVDVVTYMKAADLLICTDDTPLSEEVVIKAAAVGLPILATRTELRSDVFIDNENAFLCHKDDTIDFSQKLSKFLNNNGLRVQLSRNARTTIKDRLHEDPEVFKVAYRDAIESALIEMPKKFSFAPKSITS